MKKINGHQILIFYFIYSFSIKFVMLPQLMSHDAGKDVWIAAIFAALVELGILFVVLRILSKGRQQDIYETLRIKTTFIGAKFLMLAIFAFFLFQLFLTLGQTENLLSQTLYDELNVNFFVVPILLLGIFFCYTKTRAIFRSGEIFYVPLLVGIFLAILPAIWKVELGEITPILAKGANPIFHAVYKNFVFFDAPIILLFFKGEIQIKKTFARNFFISAAIGAAVFVGFVLFFYSVFGPLYSLRPLGIIDITGLNSYIAKNGRLEWIISCIWLLLLLIRFGVLFYVCFACLRFITHIKFQPAAIVFPLAVAIYFAHLFASKVDFLSIIRPFVPMFYFLLIVCLLIPGGKNDKKPVA